MVKELGMSIVEIMDMPYSLFMKQQVAVSDYSKEITPTAEGEVDEIKKKELGEQLNLLDKLTGI